MQRWLSRRVAIMLASGLVGLLLALLLALYVVQRDRTMPNTTVAGLEVGRLTSGEVRDALAPLVVAREDEPIEVVFEDRVFELSPSEVGYAVDLDGTIGAAMARGRSGAPFEIGARVRSLRATEEVPVSDAFDAGALAAWVEDLADAVDRDISPGRVEADPTTLEVHREPPHGSATVRRDETVASLTDMLTSDGARELELPVDTEPQLVPDDALQAVVEQVETAIADELELTAGEESLSFSPPDLASIIEVVERPDGDAATLELTVDASAVGDVIGEVGDRFHTEPVDAGYESSRTPPVSFDVQGSTSFSPVEADVDIVAGQLGTRFELDLLVDQLEQLLRDGTRSADLELATIEPELSTERAEELRPTHLLGTFTTYHAAGGARVVNIQKLADTIDDALLLPGEQFSINGISGRRTCAGGYRPAGTIVRGELTDTCGGGTSQFATTTYNAAFFAGVQIDQWKAHSWYFTRYPMGREATLNYPELDVKFTNTTDGALIVRTTYTAGSITVSLYGQPVAEQVSARHSGAFAHRNYSEDITQDPDRCEGEREVRQDGAGGFSANVVRTIELLDGATEEETISTVYVPRTRMVVVGSKDCSPDEDDEDEDDGDEDDGDDEDEDDGE